MQQVGASGREGDGGFTLIELVAAITLVVVGLLSLAAIYVPVTRQREQAEAQIHVLQAARSIFEEIKAVSPATVTSFDRNTYPVAHVQGVGGADVLTVGVVTIETGLLSVSISGAWVVGDHDEYMTLYTQIFDPEA